MDTLITLITQLQSMIRARPDSQVKIRKQVEAELAVNGMTVKTYTDHVRAYIRQAGGEPVA